MARKGQVEQIKKGDASRPFLLPAGQVSVGGGLYKSPQVLFSAP